MRAATSSTGHAVQTKLETPRAKNDSAKLGARSSERRSDSSGVTPDSQAVDAVQLVGPQPRAAREYPAGVRRVLGVVGAVAREVEHVVVARHEVAQDVGAFGLVRPEESHDLDAILALLLVDAVEALEEVCDLDALLLRALERHVRGRVCDDEHAHDAARRRRRLGRRREGRDELAREPA
jgi:hypothetical protein